MKDKINLDELLKQEMGNLSSTPPADAWQFISNQLPVVPAAPVAASVKTLAGISTKVIIATTIGVVAISAAAFVVLNKDNKPVKTNTTLVEPQIENALETTISQTQLAPINNGVEQTQLANKKEVLAVSKPTPKTKQNTNNNQTPVANLTLVDRLVDSKNTSEAIQKPIVDEHKEIIAPIQTPKSNQPSNNQQQINQLNNVADEAFLKPNIPNVFTPNNDGYNDEFVITIENELVFDLKITDAKGNVVFESKDKNKHWNGTSQKTGENCESGLYVLVFRYQVVGMKEPKIEQGFVLLKQ